jgi:NADH-quinone oxidoreductase subunit L
MVTAGVYLIARSMPLVTLAPSVLLLIAVIGCATALLSAAIALSQNDLKRVMAYSTVSQLGYMFMALGSGVGTVAQLAVVAAMFHLFTHAFFKALLFLASGSVMHAMGDVIDMRRFGGLRHRMPYTHATFAVGGLALAAIPVLSGFFSKDEILLAISSASHAATQPGIPWLYSLIYWLAILTAFLTGFYTARAYFMTFWGPEKLPAADDPAAMEDADVVASHDRIEGESGLQPAHHGEIGHESPPLMIYPLIALAGCTILIGLVCLLAAPFGGTTGWFAHHLHETLGFHSLGHAEHGFAWLTAALGTVAGLAGIGLAYLIYVEASPIRDRIIERVRPLYQASVEKFYVDEIYERYVVRPVRAFGAVCEFLDNHVVDRLVEGVAGLPSVIGRDWLASYQNGLIQFYAAGAAVSVAALLLILLLV